MIQAGDDFPIIWARDPRAESGSLLEGEFDLNQGTPDPNEAVTRILFRAGDSQSTGSSPGSSVITFNDNGPISLGDYFGTGGVGNDYTIYIQTTDNVVSFPISEAYGRGGGSFVHFDVPIDAQSTIASIASGTVFIFAIARQQVSLVGTLDAGTPNISGKLSTLSLVNFDATGLETEVLALIEAGDDVNRIYARPPNGTQGNLVTDNSGISNDLTIGSNGLIRLINRHSSGATIELTETSSLNLDTYFGSGGDGNNLSLYIQTDSGLVVIDSIGSTGASFVIFNVPASDRAVIQDIEAGDRFIIALARISPVLLNGDIQSGSPILAGTLTVIPPGGVVLSGDIVSGIPNLSGTLTVTLPSGISLLGNILAGSPDLTGMLTVTQPLGVSLSGTLIAGIPELTGTLIVTDPSGIILLGSLIAGTPDLTGMLVVVNSNVPDAPTSPSLTTSSVGTAPTTGRLVLEIETSASGEEFTLYVTGVRLAKVDELFEWNERAIASRFKAS